MCIYIMIFIKKQFKTGNFVFENTPMVQFHSLHFGTKRNTANIMFLMNTPSVAR